MSTSIAPRQLVLALDHAVSFAREDFLSGPSNAAALDLVERWPDWPNPIMALIGPEGSGKSHLAAIWAEISGARVLSAKRLGETDLPAALATGALVVEDLTPEELDERALFHLFNLAREDGAYLLLTARSAPAGFTLTIRDLISRLRSVPAVTLAAPDDTRLRALIVKLAADRSGDLVVRVYESTGARTQGELRVAESFERVEEISLVEDPIAEVSADGGVVALSLGAFEVRTLRFHRN